MEFLQKPVDDDVLLDAVQARRAVRTSHRQSRKPSAVTPAASARLDRLSGREREVLERIVQG